MSNNELMVSPATLRRERGIRSFRRPRGNIEPGGNVFEMTEDLFAHCSVFFFGISLDVFKLT